MEKNVGIIANERRLLPSIGAFDSKGLSNVKMFILLNDTSA